VVLVVAVVVETTIMQLRQKMEIPTLVAVAVEVMETVPDFVVKVDLVLLL
jgi:hypothetical protein